jgi:hypothetical protein
MEEVIDLDMLRMDSCKFDGIVPSVLLSSRQSDRRGISYAARSNAQGDDAVKSSLTGGRVVRQWYRRGSVVLALLLARRHRCQKSRLWQGHIHGFKEIKQVKLFQMAIVNLHCSI